MWRKRTILEQKVPQNSPMPTYRESATDVDELENNRKNAHVNFNIEEELNNWRMKKMHERENWNILNKKKTNGILIPENKTREKYAQYLEELKERRKVNAKELLILPKISVTNIEFNSTPSKENTLEFKNSFGPIKSSKYEPDVQSTDNLLPPKTRHKKRSRKTTTKRTVSSMEINVEIPIKCSKGPRCEKIHYIETEMERIQSIRSDYLATAKRLNSRKSIRGNTSILSRCFSRQSDKQSNKKLPDIFKNKQNFENCITPEQQQLLEENRRLKEENERLQKEKLELLLTDKEHAKQIPMINTKWDNVVEVLENNLKNYPKKYEIGDYFQKKLNAEKEENNSKNATESEKIMSLTNDLFNEPNLNVVDKKPNSKSTTAFEINFSRQMELKAERINEFEAKTEKLVETLDEVNSKIRNIEVDYFKNNPIKNNAFQNETTLKSQEKPCFDIKRKYQPVNYKSIKDYEELTIDNKENPQNRQTSHPDLNKNTDISVDYVPQHDNFQIRQPSNCKDAKPQKQSNDTDWITKVNMDEYHRNDYDENVIILDEISQSLDTEFEVQEWLKKLNTVTKHNGNCEDNDQQKESDSDYEDCVNVNENIYEKMPVKITEIDEKYTQMDEKMINDSNTENEYVKNNNHSIELSNSNNKYFLKGNTIYTSSGLMISTIYCDDKQTDFHTTCDEIKPNSDNLTDLKHSKESCKSLSSIGDINSDFQIETICMSISENNSESKINAKSESKGNISINSTDNNLILNENNSNLSVELTDNEKLFFRSNNSGQHCQLVNRKIKGNVSEIMNNISVDMFQKDFAYCKNSKDKMKCFYEFQKYLQKQNHKEPKVYTEVYENLQQCFYDQKEKTYNGLESIAEENYSNYDNKSDDFTIKSFVDVSLQSFENSQGSNTDMQLNLSPRSAELLENTLCIDTKNLQKVDKALLARRKSNSTLNLESLTQLDVTDSKATNSEEIEQLLTTDNLQDALKKDNEDIYTHIMHSNYLQKALNFEQDLEFLEQEKQLKTAQIQEHNEIESISSGDDITISSDFTMNEALPSPASRPQEVINEASPRTKSDTLKLITTYVTEPDLLKSPKSRAKMSSEEAEKIIELNNKLLEENRMLQQKLNEEKEKQHKATRQDHKQSLYKRVVSKPKNITKAGDLLTDAARINRINQRVNQVISQLEKSNGDIVSLLSTKGSSVFQPKSRRQRHPLMGIYNKMLDTKNNSEEPKFTTLLPETSMSRSRLSKFKLKGRKEDDDSTECFKKSIDFIKANIKERNKSKLEHPNSLSEIGSLCKSATEGSKLNKESMETKLKCTTIKPVDTEISNSSLEIHPSRKRIHFKSPSQLSFKDFIF